MTPLRPVCDVLDRLPDAHVGSAARRAHRVAQRGAVEIGDHPGGHRQLDRDAVRLAGAVVGEHDPDRAGVLRAIRLRENVQNPRETSAIAPFSESRGSAFAGSVRVAARRRRGGVSTGCAAAADDRADVDECLASTSPTRRRRRRRVWIGMWSTCVPPAVRTRERGCEDLEFETAATEIAFGAVPGEPIVPNPKSSRSLPAAMTGTTPAAATLSIDRDHRCRSAAPTRGRRRRS